jgi:hypothetical protein
MAVQIGDLNNKYFYRNSEFFIKFCYKTEKETANENYDFLKAVFGDYI